MPVMALALNSSSVDRTVDRKQLRMLLASIENLHCLQVPNGELSASQLRWLGDSIANLEGDGCGDITTRANIQLRGMTLAEADKIFAVLSLPPCECRCSIRLSHLASHLWWCMSTSH